MEAKELNQGISKLREIYLNLDTTNLDNYFKQIDAVIKPLFMKYYMADSEFEHMDKTSMKTMLRLNVKHRFVSLHSFGLQINL